jgi:hypothetical protein
MDKEAELQRALRHKPVVSKLMMLAIELRHSPIETFDGCYKALQNALYKELHLQEDKPEPVKTGFGEVDRLMGLVNQMLVEDQDRLPDLLTAFSFELQSHLVRVVDEPKFPRRSAVKHLETGGYYLITGIPQDSNKLKTDEGWRYCYSYIPLNGDTSTYHRCQSEMEDGRFVAVELVEKPTQGNSK